jgi:hypothetical protein
VRETQYTDTGGRLYKVLVPDSAPESHARYGIVVGPPNLDSLELDEKIATRINNELFNRGIFTYKDARRRRGEIYTALQSALRVEVGLIMDLYLQESNNG